MSTNAQETVVPQIVHVYLAPVGTAAPADATTAMPITWREVGHTTPDSLNFNTEDNFEEGRSHQSFFAIRRWQTSAAATLEVDLEQWNSDNFIAAYGGGTITEIPGPPIVYKFSPPGPGGRSEIAAVVEIIDGLKRYRRVIPRSQQVEGVSQPLNQTAMALLPLRLSILAADVGDPWYMITSDPSFEAAA